VLRAAAIVAVLIVWGCGGLTSDGVKAGATIDGITLGPEITCDSCAEIDAAAGRKLESSRPNHAVVSETLHFADPLPSGAERSGTSTVVIFNMADGSRAAYLVYCGVGGCAAG